MALELEKCDYKIYYKVVSVIIRWRVSYIKMSEKVRELVKRQKQKSEEYVFCHV